MELRNFSAKEVLLNALREGDTKAFEYVYQKSLLSILSFVYKNRGDEADAEDLLQEAIIVLFEKLQDPTFVLTCNVPTYIYSICRYKWLNKLRARRLLMDFYNIKGSIVKVVDVEEYLEISNIVEDEAQVELENKLQSAFSILDHTCQDILTRSYFYNQELEKIALSINYSSANAVKVRKFRCIQKLRELIKH